MNGWITIGTKLDTKELEAKLKQAEKQLKDFDKEAKDLEKQKLQAEYDIAEAEMAKELLEDQVAEYQELAKAGEDVSAELEEQQQTIDLINAGIEMYKQDLTNINGKMEANKEAQEQTKKAMAETNEEIRKAQAIDKIKKGADGLQKSMRDVVKSAVRWGLAIFGIQGALNFLRSSISTISQYNDQVATDIEYIRFALASTLEPVILRLISLVKTLLAYVNYIAQAWFGINLFANAGVDKFKKSSDALGSASKNAKELNKQLAGFDEMNVLQDNTSAGGGGGGGAGATMPSFDLSTMDVEPPEFLKFIVLFKDEILAVMAGVATGLLAWKLGLDPIMSLGIGIIIAGIVLLIEGLIGYLNDPSWENFGKVIQGIGIALMGLALVIGGPAGVALAIVGAIVLIYGTVIKYWDLIQAFLQKGIDWLTGKSDWVHKVFGDTIGNIYDTFVGVLGKMLEGWDNTFKAIKRIFDDVIGIVKAIINGDWKTAWEKAKDIVKTIFDTIVKNIKLAFSAVWDIIKVVGQTVGDLLWGIIKGAINGILASVESVINAPIKTMNKLLDVLNKIPGVNIGKINTFSLPRLAKGGIINQPGRGVMVGSAIAGERGREGVIPLTDSQQMALLGEAIGKYITVNASITNTMNGRVISRELQRVQNQNDFAFNR